MHPRVVSLIASATEIVCALGAGEALVAELRARMDSIAARARGAGHRPRVACLEWIDPLMAAGNWNPELVELAGGLDPLGRAGAHSPTIAWADVCRADPDLIVVMPCGFDLTRTRREAQTLVGQPGFEALRAVRDGRVVLVDGNQFFNRPGPRLVESLEIMAELVHPGLFHFAHEGTGWERLALR